MSDYVPKPDPEGINSPSSSAPVRDVIILLSGFLGIVIAFYLLFTMITDLALSRISLQTEMRYLGKLWSYTEINQQPNPDLDNFVNLLNQHVPFKLRASIVCDSRPNAFALPGGVIYLTRGLLQKVKTENGLAFVLGHEIGHFMNRDHLRGAGRQILFLLGSAFFGLGDMSGVAVLNRAITTSFNRDQEADADEYGLALVHKLYGHTFGAEEFFIEMAKSENPLDQRMNRFFSTHPLSSERRARIEATQTGPAPALVDAADRFNTWLAAAHCAR